MSLLGKGFAFLIGVASLLLIESVHSAVIIGVCSVISLLVIHLIKKFKRLVRGLNINFLLMGLIWSCLNIVLWSVHSSQIIASPIKTSVDGVICSIPTLNGDRLQFDFCLDKINNKLVRPLIGSRFKFTWGKFASSPSAPLKAGQYWQFYAKLKPPHGRYNPAGFDYQKWMLAQGYSGNGNVINSRPLTKSSIQSQYHQARQLVYEKLMAFLSESPYQGLLIALAMGEREGIDQEQWEVLRQSGTSHLLAISGLHVGVAALWCYWIMLFLWKKSETLCLMFPAQKAAQVVSILGALSILLLSGMGLPAQRAFIMLLVFVASRWSGRNYSLFSVLGIALVLVLTWHPFAVLSASFWLSFYAVFIIALGLNHQSGNTEGSYRSKLFNWLKINIYLYIAMLPISILFFGMFSLVAIFANLILVPIASFLLIPILYLAMLMMLFNSMLAGWLFVLSNEVIKLIYWVQFELALINFESMGERLNSLLAILLMILLCLLLLPRKLFSKFIYLPLLLISFLALLLPHKSSQSESNILELIVFDIGQGLSIYIETPDGNILYDTGWGNEEFNLVKSVVAPFLESRGVSIIDKLVISHADSDHSGGVNYILSNYQVNQLISGESLQNKQVIDCHNYPSWIWKGVSFKFLHHLPLVSRQGNNASCVMSIETEQINILLTGDIEKAAELALIKNGISHYDVLVAPHHGSKTSSTQAFIDKIQPKEVVFSTGYNNQWNFPKKEVVTRYQSVASRIWVTHEVGAFQIKLNIDHNQSTFSSEKLNNPHFWH
jgi:competence protein ComEC